MQCSSCAATVGDDARFCPNCGHRLATPTEERRVVTVLFADLVGFTSVAEHRDPEEVKRLVDSCFERLVADIVEFGGRVDKIIGDAIVALFGAPIAHTDDAERAVRAGLRMQATLSGLDAAQRVGMKMRIGINTGEVLVGALRAGGDYTAMGDVVNLAQRIQSTSEPGTVSVGPDTHALTEEVFQYEPLGLLHAKGRGEPVETFMARSVLGRPGRPIRRTAPLIGREREQAMLGTSIELAVTHSRSQLLVLQGEAGAGKSRLTVELTTEATARLGFWSLGGVTPPYGESNPWYPLAEAFRSAYGLASERGRDDELSGGALAARCWNEVASRLAPGTPAEEIERVTDGLLHVLGESTSSGSTDPARANEEATRSVVALLEAATRARPVILICSDAEWADEVIVGVLDQLLTNLAAAPFVLLLTMGERHDEKWQVLLNRPNVIVHRLDPLDPDSADALIDALGGNELDVATRAALIERSGGNPLYLEELMNIVRDGRDTNALPAGLHGLVSARLDRLGPAERAMLENAAILGLSGNSATLLEMGAVLGQNPSNDVMLRLGAEDLLQINGDRWTFRSALVREVAYGRLTKSVRAARHLEIAQAIERLAPERDDRAELIGSHYAAAAELSADVSVDMPADLTERAVHWLRVASENASRRHLNGVALRLGLRALALVPVDDPGRSQMVLLCGWLAAYARDAVSARNMVEQLNADHTLSPGTTAGARCLAGIVEQLNGDLDRAVELFEDTIERTKALPESTELRAAALRWLGTTHMMRGEHELAREVLLEAISVYDAIGSAGGRAWALENLAWVAFAAGDLESADGLLADAAVAADQINDIGGRSAIDGIAGFVDCRRGRYADARVRAGGVLADAKLRGDRRQIAAMEQLLALVESADGQLESAIDHAQRSIAICRELHEHYREGISLAALCRAELGRGRLAEIGANLERLQALTRTHHTRDLAAQTATQLAVLGGAPERVSGVLEAAAAGVVTLALFHLQRGEVDEALAAIDTARPTTAADVHALEAVKALALVNAGRAVDAISTASNAIDARDAKAFDRLLASIAVVIAHARLGDAESLRVAILGVRKEIESTDDLLAAALGLIAEAAADALLAPESEKAKRAEAVTALRDLRLGPQAWLRATCSAEG